jgi:hypothetical protein
MIAAYRSLFVAKWRKIVASFTPAAWRDLTRRRPLKTTPRKEIHRDLDDLLSPIHRRHPASRSTLDILR